jgi:predicted NodU family carbamoyl transferase
MADGGPTWGHDCRALRTKLGYGVVANTSFNSKGLPMVNSAALALRLLEGHRGNGMFGVLIENWFFT